MTRSTPPTSRTGATSRLRPPRPGQRVLGGTRCGAASACSLVWHVPWKAQLLMQVGIDYVGEGLAAFFGITTPKYQYVIDELIRQQREVVEAYCSMQPYAVDTGNLIGAPRAGGRGRKSGRGASTTAGRVTFSDHCPSGPRPSDRVDGCLIHAECTHT